MSEPTKVTVGQVIKADAGEFTVLPACDIANNGHWYCATHNQDFPHNLGKDSHLSEAGSHQLAWICHEHGPEVP